AKRRRAARPMPLAAPVTIARLPWSRPARAGLDTRVEDRARDEPRALVALLGRLQAVREADELLTAAVGEERGAPRVLHARLPRELGQPRLVGAGRQPDPQEEPALGLADLRATPIQHLVKAPEHGVPLGAVDVDEQGDVWLEMIAQEVGRDP